MAYLLLQPQVLVGFLHTHGGWLLLHLTLPSRQDSLQKGHLGREAMVKFKRQMCYPEDNDGTTEVSLRQHNGDKGHHTEGKLSTLKVRAPAFYEASVQSMGVM